MSIGSRRFFALVAAMVAVLALAGAAVYAASVSRGGDEAQADITSEIVDGVRLGKVTNNKGKSAVGMCVYSEADNELTFERVAKGNKDKDDPVIQALNDGGEFADSQADCDELNAILENPPEPGDQSDVIEVKGKAEPPPGRPNAEPSSPEAIEGRKIFEKVKGGEEQAGEPKAKR